MFVLQRKDKMNYYLDIAEAVLGHSKKGIEGTYNLHNYEAECAEWLQKWADHMEKLI